MKLSTIYTILVSAEAFSWVGISNEKTEKFNCRSSVLFNQQKRLCSLKSEFLPAVKRAAKLTRENCKYEMRNNAWDCSDIDKLPRLVSKLKTSSPENAYVHGLSSAQLVTALYRLCNSGTVGECDVEQVAAFTQQFTGVASLSKRRLSIAQIELHNAKVGRSLAWSSINKICRCHGASGSCLAKTCFETAPIAPQVARLATQKYKQSIEVKIADDRKDLPVMITDQIASNMFLHLH